MPSDEITWDCDGQRCSIGLHRAGSGPSVLLLPAPSSISTRGEMRPLQELLAGSFSTVAVDWPGFGDRAKPRVDWRPQLYEDYLAHVLSHVAPDAFAVVSAGHAAGYVLQHFARHGSSAVRLVLLSPTWRGPLPTMLGRHRAIYTSIASAFDSRLWGPILYRLNVNRPMVAMMARGHVYADPHWLRGPRMKEKLAVTRAPGARHGSARFVTGCLDPFRSREEQMQAAHRVAAPMLVVYAQTAPRKSRVEMEALSALPNVSTVRLAQGKLSFYEEFPEATTAAVGPFLSAGTAAGNAPESDTAAS